MKKYWHDNEKTKYTLAYDSLDEFLDYMSEPSRREHRDREMCGEPDVEWYGARDTGEAIEIARRGLSDEGIEAAHLADDVLEQVEREVELPSFSSFYDVSGADVDVARYLSGEPECMINYHMVDTPKAGRVITIVVSVSASAGITPREIKERGVQVMALMLAIEKMGLQTEVWIEQTSQPSGRYADESPEPYRGVIKMPIKSAGEQFDPGRMMYAFTHPSMLRVLCLGAMHELPKSLGRKLNVGTTYGRPAKAVESDFPEGSVFIRHANLGETFSLAKVLKEIGLL